MSVKGQGLAAVSVICPFFNAETEIIPLDHALSCQKGVKIAEKQYILTQSRDHTEDVLQAANIPYQLISKADFSHSKTREKAAMESTGEIIVFLTQDVVIKDDDFISKLVAPIVSGKVDASYARQKTKYNNIEKYTREHNYPAKSFIVSKSDIPQLGLKTFFFSDAAGAIRASKFRELKGYDGKDLPISEDMYFAYKLIMCGGKIGYVADAVVYHSHKFSLKQLYDRYKLTGEFMALNPEIAEHGINAAGGGMAKKVLSGATKDKNFRVLASYIPNMAVRYAGMVRGRRGGRKISNYSEPVVATRGRLANVAMRKGER